MSNANIEYRKAKDKRGKPVRGLWKPNPPEAQQDGKPHGTMFALQK
jgi:hypothetical protein